MKNVIQFEGRVSRSRSKHEGEPSAEICDRLSRTRVSSQRQLPTDHDYAVPTREYQLDQSSPLPATAAAYPVLEVQRQKQPQRLRILTGSHHINLRIADDPGTTAGGQASEPLLQRSACPSMLLITPTALGGIRELLRRREHDEGYADDHEKGHTDQFSTFNHVAP